MKTIGQLILTLLLLALIVGDAIAADKFQRYNFSILNIKMEDKERIEEFRITILHGFVISIPHVPPGWSIHLDNSPQWKTVVSGSASVGVAAIPRGDMGIFDNFLVIQRDDLDHPIRTEAELTLYKEGSTMIRRKVKFANDEMKLEQIKD